MINFLAKHLQLLYTWNLLFQQKSFHYLAFLFIHLQLTSFISFPLKWQWFTLRRSVHQVSHKHLFDLFFKKSISSAIEMHLSLQKLYNWKYDFCPAKIFSNSNMRSDLKMR